MNERRELKAQAESTQQVAVEHASSLAERLPEELISAVRWMCVHAARRVAFEEPLPGEKPRKHAAEAEKSQLAFQKQQAVVAQHVPAALATSLAEIGAHAARYAARSHLGLDAPVERITGVDIPMPYAANLEKLALPQVSDIVRVAKRVCYRE